MIPHHFLEMIKVILSLQDFDVLFSDDSYSESGGG